MRWGVDLPPVRTLTSTWSADAAELSWDRVPGSFVTGYQLEGAASPDGPWERTTAETATRVRVQDPAIAYYRVAARTLTGAVGRTSPVAPANHLAALAAFRAKDWARARTLATEALATVAGGAATADNPALLELRWAGYVSAHELEDHDDVLRWAGQLQADPGAHAFEFLFRLADTRQQQGELRQAMEHASTALRAPAGSTPEQLATLRQLVFSGALELKIWDAAAEMGEEIIRVSNTNDPAFVERVIRAHLESGNPTRAQLLIQTAIAGSPSAQQLRRFDVLSVVTANQLGDHAAALELSKVVGTSLDADLFVMYEGALASSLLQTGDREAARFELMSLTKDPQDYGALGDMTVARSAVALYGSYVEAGQIENGRSMLDSMLAVLPAEMAEVRGWVLQQADSVGAVADTRLKLGEGFKLYEDALFRDALRFFQAANDRTDLDVDQRLIVKELLASVLYSFQRIPDADEIYRGVFDVDPDFNLSAHLEHVSQVYGITVFADDLLLHFSEVGPLR